MTGAVLSELGELVVFPQPTARQVMEMKAANFRRGVLMVLIFMVCATCVVLEIVGHR